MRQLFPVVPEVTANIQGSWLVKTFFSPLAIRSLKKQCLPSQLTNVGCTWINNFNFKINVLVSSIMVGEMVQNSQSLHSFTFNPVIVIHEYIYSHSTTEFTFKKYIYSHLPVYFLFMIIFAHIYEMSSFTFNMLYSFTFTIEKFIQHFLRTTFVHH